MKLTLCNGFPEIYARLEGVHLSDVYVHSIICKSAVVYWCCIDLLSIGGRGWGVNMPWVYVHSAIYETYVV